MILTEAAHAQPTIVYHGTSSVLARSILKHGMLADPPKRTWAEDPHTSVHAQSRVSLSGSYWSSNLMTAMSAVMRANQQHGVEKDWRDTPGLVVIAEIIEASALADEDSINGVLNTAWAIMNKSLGLIPEAVTAALYLYYQDPEEHRRKRQAMLDLFMRTLHEGLRGSEQQPVPGGLLERAFVAELNRLWAHTTWSSFGGGPEQGIDPGRLPAKPSPADAERELLAVKDVLTRYYRKSAFKRNDSFMHTLRMDQPVGYSGSNRIVAMVQYTILNKHKEPLTLVYGKSVPLDFIAQWRDRCGPFPGLNRQDGAVLIKPDADRELSESMIGDLPPKGWLHLRTRDYVPVRHLHYVDLLERPDQYGIGANPVLMRIAQNRPAGIRMEDYVYDPPVWTALRDMMFDQGWVRVNGMNGGNVVIDANDMPSVAHAVLFLMDHGAPIDGVTYDVRYPNPSRPSNGHIDERHLRVFLRNGGQARRAAIPA